MARAGPIAFIDIHAYAFAIHPVALEAEARRVGRGVRMHAHTVTATFAGMLICGRRQRILFLKHIDQEINTTV